MIIKLHPQRQDGGKLEIIKLGSSLSLNGEIFDLDRVKDGDTLPLQAITSVWFADDVDHIDGHLIVHLVMPIPYNYSPEQAFPEDIVDPKDGLIALPKPLPESEAVQTVNEVESE